VSELRRTDSRRRESSHYAADDEDERDVPRRRLLKPRAKHPGIKRRSAAENTISVVTFILAPLTILTYSFRGV